MKLKPEQAQTATSPSNISPSYWDSAFSCHEDASTCLEIADTGPSSHMYGDENKFDSLTSSKPVSISIASKDGAIRAFKQGQVTVNSLVLKNVLHLKELLRNLILIGRLCDDGCKAVFERTSGSIINPSGNTLLRFTRDPHSDKLWHPVRQSASQYALLARTDSVLLANDWHRRLGHLHPDGVIEFLKQTGQPCPNKKDFMDCNDCLEGKSSRSPSTTSFH